MVVADERDLTVSRRRARRSLPCPALGALGTPRLCYCIRSVISSTMLVSIATVMAIHRL